MSPEHWNEMNEQIQFEYDKQDEDPFEFKSNFKIDDVIVDKVAEFKYPLGYIK